MKVHESLPVSRAVLMSLCDTGACHDTVHSIFQVRAIFIAGIGDIAEPSEKLADLLFGHPTWKLVGLLRCAEVRSIRAFE